MDNQKFVKYKTAFIVVAVLIALLGILGIFDLRNAPYEGFGADPNNTVTKVFPDSPAQQAGVQAGDRLISSGGIDMKDNLALVRRPRAKIGETRTYVVERSGESVNLELTFAGLPARGIASSSARTILGFCFLIFGLWAYLKVQNNYTTLLVLLGLCLSYVFISKPHIQLTSDKLRLALTYVNITLLYSAVVWGLAFLLHFMMAFPKVKALLLKKNMLIVLYGPAALIGLLLVFSNLILSLIFGVNTETKEWNLLFMILFIPCFLGYSVLATVAMVHSYVKATPQERAANGLNFMLLGTVIGLAPSVIIAIVGIIAPKVPLPGVEFYVLTMVLIPFALAQAILKKEKALAPALA